MVRIPGTTFSDLPAMGIPKIEITKAAKVFAEYMWRSAGLDPEETQTDNHLTQKEMEEHLIRLLVKAAGENGDN